MSRKLLVLSALVILVVSGQSQAITWRTANTSATALDLLQTSTWSGGVAPGTTEGAYFGGTQATTYTLSADMSIGNWSAYHAGSTTFDLGAGRTLNVVSDGVANGTNIGCVDYGTAYVATLTVKSGTMAFSGTDPILIGYSGGARVVGSREHNFIIDNGGTVNMNGTYSGASAGSMLIDRSGLVWVKSGGILNLGSASRLRVGLDGAQTPYEGTLQVDGTFNVAGKLPIGDYRPSGTMQVSGTVNLTGSSNQLGNGPQVGTGMGVGSKILLTGGSIVATTTHQSFVMNTQTGATSATATPGLIMGNGVFDNIDVTLNPGTGHAGWFKLAPGVDAATGTIEFRNANLAESNGQIVALDLGSSSADKLLVSTAGKSATIANGITYSALDSLATINGNFDMVVAPTITYGGTALAIGSDIGTVAGDNLVALLNTAGYTRVTGAAPGANQFRYYVADAGNGLKAIRVQFTPEPVTLGLLAIGALALIGRRRAA